MKGISIAVLTALITIATATVCAQTSPSRTAWDTTPTTTPTTAVTESDAAKAAAAALLMGGNQRSSQQMGPVSSTGGQLNSVDNSRSYNNTLPTYAGAAPVHADVGLGVASVSNPGGGCGQLRDVDDEDSEYAFQHLIAKTEKMTLGGQHTDHLHARKTYVRNADGSLVMTPVLGANGIAQVVNGQTVMAPLTQVEDFLKIHIGGGLVRLDGTRVVNRTRMSIAAGTSSSIGVGGVGGAAGGTVSAGNSGSISGSQEMDITEFCTFGEFKELKDGTLETISPDDNIDLLRQKLQEVLEENKKLQDDKENLEAQLKRCTTRCISK